MRLKLKHILLGIVVIISLFLVKAVSTNSTVSWHVGTLKSDLWAASQQFTFQTPKVASETLSERENQASIFPNSGSSKNDAIATPTFPLGWYSSVDYPDDLGQINTEVINFVIPYTGKRDVQKVKAYLDRARDAGIKVMVEIPRIEVRKDHRWLITQFVKQLKDHPALHSWYLYDEPEYVQMSPRILERVYQAIKTEDPQHSIAIAFGKLDRVGTYLNALDTVLYFNYPCYHDLPQFCNFENSGFGQLTANAAQFIKAKDNFWMVLQGYGEDKYGKPRNNRRLPSIEEEKYMIYSSILAQANGLLFWAHYLSQQQWIDTVLTPLLQELNEYLPAITNRRIVPRVVVNNSAIQARLFRNPQNNSLLLIALNHSSQTTETEMALRPQVRVQTARVLQEDRTLALQQGALTDRFEPFAVHVYQLGANS